MADTNPSNFANLPKERVQEIAAMGGKASHGANNNTDDTTNDGKKENEDNGRNLDGSFKPGSVAAKEAGHVGGLHAHGKKTEEEKKEVGRDDEGKFLPGSEAAKEAGHKGGLAAAASN